MPRTQLCQWLDLPRSVSYYRPRLGKPGAKPSQLTLRLDGSWVPNQEVVEHIWKWLDDEFNAYGYEYVTHELKTDYVINKKKVYRLMKEANLLMGKVFRPAGKREFVQFRRITTTRPLEYLCWDIKYAWVAGERRNYFLLSVMDVYTRKILDWIFQPNIRQMDLINLVRQVNREHELKGIIIRNDNGSQFIANRVRQFLKTSEVKQEFTHVATPEENSYIEAFHSILDQIVVQRYEFDSYYEAKETLRRFFNHYNYNRRHRSLGFITPQEKWEIAMACDSTILENLSN